MVEINKEHGKIMKEIAPQYVKATSHKRHYYMVESKNAYKLLDKIKNGNY